VNLQSLNGKVFQLDMGSHPNKILQKEWNEFGKNAFIIEVLEIQEKKEDEYIDIRDALQKLEEKWLNALHPHGENGYNSK